MSITLLSVFILAMFINQSHKQTSSESSLTNTGSLFQKEGIAVVDLYGPISFAPHSSTLFPAGADAVLNQLDAIEQDPHIKGLIIRINSPGGTVGASQEIYQAIKQVKQTLNIPIIAQIGDVGASGAYYAALAADTIYANPGSLVGSIGVILGNINIKELSDKYGINYEVYKSGAYKDLLSMWRPTTENEKQLLQKLVDNVHQQFTGTFIKERNLSKKQGKALAQGQIFTGEQAAKLHIIDQLGSYKDAVKEMGKLTKLGPHPKIISKGKPHWKDIINTWGTSIQKNISHSLFIPQNLH